MSRLWLVGGSDPTGGAGVDRDRWAATKTDPRVELVVLQTADTRQGDGLPARVFPAEPATLKRAIERAAPPSAVKIGLVPPALAPTLEAALDALAPCPVVLDPVLSASDGGRFCFAPDLAGLWQRASVRTPNFEEACEFAGSSGLEEVLQRLGTRGDVLVKSCPSSREEVCDVLILGGVHRALRRPRRAGEDPRGTGCALASAIATHLAVGATLETAVLESLEWLAHARARTVRGPDDRPHLA